MFNEKAFAELLKVHLRIPPKRWEGGAWFNTRTKCGCSVGWAARDRVAGLTLEMSGEDGDVATVQQEGRDREAGDYTFHVLMRAFGITIEEALDLFGTPRTKKEQTARLRAFLAEKRSWMNAQKMEGVSNENA